MGRFAWITGESPVYHKSPCKREAVGTGQLVMEPFGAMRGRCLGRRNWGGGTAASGRGKGCAPESAGGAQRCRRHAFIPRDPFQTSGFGSFKMVIKSVWLRLE